ncbi:MAG: baseplate J/gp47 family protein [Acidaminococcaceae bacterium]
MNVKDIEFVNTDTETIKNEVIAAYETLAQRILAAGDPVRLFLEAVASIIAQQRAVINYTGKMNLLAYAEGSYLDHLGVLVGTERIGAQPALATAKITLSAAQETAIVIPKGTRITAGDKVFFATSEEKIIPSGTLTGAVEVACTEAGAVGNGYLSGQLKIIVDPIAFVDSIINTTETGGGADVEDDENYRQRINKAPESFSCAGSDGAYEYWAKTASKLITDVSVTSPSPGAVNIVPLLAGGEIPSSEILNAVAAVCDNKKIRPLTDHVTVSAPQVVSFDVTATYYVDAENIGHASDVQRAVTTAVNEYIVWQKTKLGRDINPSELIKRMVLAGAKRVDVTAPVFTVVAKNKVGVANTPTLIFGGVDND